MKSLITLILCLAAWAGVVNFNNVKFIRNHDGDTITVTLPGVPEFFGKNVDVRIRGIDTAEMTDKSDCGSKLAATARDLVFISLHLAHKIDLKNVGREKYGRLLADVEFQTTPDSEKRDLGKLLISKNLAVPYFGAKKENTDWCKHE